MFCCVLVWVNLYGCNDITGGITYFKNTVLQLTGPCEILDAIFQMQISILFYLLISSNHLIIKPWEECHRTLLIIRQHWSRVWLGAVRQQAIAWANADPDLCRLMVSLGPQWVKTVLLKLVEFVVIVLQHFNKVPLLLKKYNWNFSLANPKGSGKFIFLIFVCSCGGEEESTKSEYLSTDAWWRHQMETFSALLAACAGNSPHKGQWRGAFMFSLICAWIYRWVNNRGAGDLRRYHAHYDVIVMDYLSLCACMCIFENMINITALKKVRALYSQHEWLIISIIKCGMKLRNTVCDPRCDHVTSCRAKALN